MGRRFASALVLAATGGALFAASADAQLFERRQDFFPFSLFGDRGPCGRTLQQWNGKGPKRKLPERLGGNDGAPNRGHRRINPH